MNLALADDIIPFVKHLIWSESVLIASLAACQFPQPPDIAGEAGPPRRTLTVTADGPGTVTSQPAGLNCAGDTCTAQFDDGATVNLTAQANGGALFTTYGGACAGPQPTCAVAMTEDRAVTATFAAFQCTPNTTTCTQQQLVECDGSGVAQVTPCLFGCHPGGTRCYDLAPSNVGIAACLDASAVEPDAIIPDGSTINTDDGTIRTAGGAPINVASETIAAPTNGVDVRCFRVNRLTIGQTTVVGSRALAIAANGDVTITGHVSVSARAFDQPGPGHFTLLTNCTGQNGTLGGGFVAGGGGGGGFGAAGGTGGTGASNNGGQGGPANGTAELVPLRGGCSGGIPGGAAAITYPNAAGAIQVVSRIGISLAASAGLSASGWGGGGGGKPTHGGGSGGAILLEAPFVQTVDAAFIVANGGGGGGLTPGTPGGITTMRAAGGPGGSSGPVPYGAGGFGGSRDGNAADGTGSTSAGGGGGGAAGRIRINTYQAFAPAAAAIVSPAPSTSTAARR